MGTGEQMQGGGEQGQCGVLYKYRLKPMPVLVASALRDEGVL